MGREDVELIRQGYDALWRRGDIEGSVAGLQPDFEWVIPGHPEGDVRRGRDDVAQFFREWLEAWEEHHVEYEIIDAGRQRVLALVEMRGRGRGSGVEVETRFAQLWTVSDGRPVRMVLYFDPDQALKDLGLDEARRPSPP